MTSAAPARKPYRKAPPQHRETRHALTTAPPPPAPQLDVNQVNRHTLNTPLPPPPPHQLPAACKQPRSSRARHGVLIPPLSDSDLDVSSLSSLELCIPQPLFSTRNRRPDRAKTTEVGVTASDGHLRRSASTRSDLRRSPSVTRKQPQDKRGERQTRAHRAPSTDMTATGTPTTPRTPNTPRTQAAARTPNLPRTQTAPGTATVPRTPNMPNTPRTQPAAPPKSILKQTAPLGIEPTYDVIRKAKSVELLDGGRRRGSMSRQTPTRSLDRAEQRSPTSRWSSAPPSPSKTGWNWRMQVLEEKVRFSSFLDEITSQVLSPAHLTMLGRAASRERGSPSPSPSPRRSRRHSHSHSHRKKPPEGKSEDRSRRWDDWVSALQRPAGQYQPLQDERAGRETPRPQDDVTEGAGHVQEALGVNRGVKMEEQETEEPQRHRHRTGSNLSALSHIKVGRD